MSSFVYIARAHAHPDIISDYMSRQLEFMTIGAEPVPTTLDNINGKTVSAHTHTNPFTSYLVLYTNTASFRLTILSRKKYTQ